MTIMIIFVLVTSQGAACSFDPLKISLFPFVLDPFNTFHCSLRIFVKVPFRSRDIPCSLNLRSGVPIFFFFAAGTPDTIT